MRFFPVLGGASFGDDFGAPRAGHTHQGNDLFGPVGRPLIAVAAGEIRYGTDVLGGNIANLRTPEGTRYYYAHLDRFEGVNRYVVPGEVVGYLGKTGNAATTEPHLHFEMHPQGGAAVDPFPFLKQAEVKKADPSPAPSPPSPPSPPQTSGSALGTTIKLGLLVAGGYLLWRRYR